MNLTALHMLHVFCFYVSTTTCLSVFPQVGFGESSKYADLTHTFVFMYLLKRIEISYMRCKYVLMFLH